MKLPKIPIDYSKAGTGEAPFDGKYYFFHTIKNIERGYWTDCGDAFSRLNCGAGSYQIWKHLSNGSLPTHFTPMPEFEEVQESKSTLLQDTYFSGIEFPEIERGGE